jgi:hypothetical protein
MIREEGAEDGTLKDKIMAAFAIVDKPTFVVDAENTVSVQAMKLAAINEFAKQDRE